MLVIKSIMKQSQTIWGQRPTATAAEHIIVTIRASPTSGCECSSCHYSHNRQVQLLPLSLVSLNLYPLNVYYRIESFMRSYNSYWVCPIMCLNYHKYP